MSADYVASGIEDGRDANKIRDVINWIYKDDFWSAVIFSAEPLRRNFDKLESQMKPVNKKNKSVINYSSQKSKYGVTVNV